MGALFAVEMLAHRSVDNRLDLGNVRPTSVRFESEAPVDDILIGTSDGGWVFIQCKTSLSLSGVLDSPLGKTADEIVRLWYVCQSSNAAFGWNRPLDANRDRIVIGVSPSAAASIRETLPAALRAFRSPSAAPLPQGATGALATMRDLLEKSWLRLTGEAALPGEIDSMLRLLRVIEFDLEGGAQAAAIETLRGALAVPETAKSAWAAVQSQCTTLMSGRRGTDSTDLRRLLGSSVTFLAPPDYRADVSALRQRSEEVRSALARFEETRIHGSRIQITRDCTRVVVDAARDGSLVLVGDPGAGKSGVINAAAAYLRDEGRDVIELAVDRLPVASLGDLRTQLGLAHGLRDVLANWPGSEPAFLFIDALDATRGGQSEAVFRTVIAEVIGLVDRRWHVVASIRTFDLFLGTQFRRLFEGMPPSADYASAAFNRVRHIHVPEWSDAEFNSLLQQAPDLRVALENGGEGLGNLARVPFNTRLLADLLSGGTDPKAFGELASQVELLGLYWQERVSQLGTQAESCLRRTVEIMIKSSRLQVRRIDASAGTGTAIDNLRQANVLVDVGDRAIAFRHHILFDYAASRVYIDPHDVTATAKMLRGNAARGLMLGPALAFALQALWVESSDARDNFWHAIVELAGNEHADAVGRSVASRAASEFPRSPADVRSLAARVLATNADGDYVAVAFANIVGALAVRAEDKQPIAVDAWCHVAGSIGEEVKRDVAWPLRTLLYLLLGYKPQTEALAELGKAARALLAFGLSEPNSNGLVASAIGFVGSTYGSDRSASRDVLEQLFTPERFSEHAHEDMEWLTREVEHIAQYDPDFVVNIFATVFGHDVRDEQKTLMGNSRILPMSSTRRQDYEMARWSLKEAFPDFIAAHPSHGARALLTTIAGYITIQRPRSTAQDVVVIRIGEHAIRLQEDHSHIWAWNPTEAHSHNAIAIANAFAEHVSRASAADVREIVNVIISENSAAVVWARTFQGCAKRDDDSADALWPWVTQSAFLTSADTRKDALDFIAHLYATRPSSERTAFENRVMGIQFPDSHDPANAQQHIRELVFGTIGHDALVTLEAKAYAHRAESQGTNRPNNERAFQIRTSSGSVDKHWWLRDQDVDVAAPPNAPLLALIDDVDTGASGDMDADNVNEAYEKLSRLIETLEKSAAHPLVIDQGWQQAARTAESLSRRTEALRQLPETTRRLVAVTKRLLALPVKKERDVDNDATPSVGGVEADALEAALNLAFLDPTTADQLLPDIRSHVVAPRAAARLAIMSRLNQLSETAPDHMWEIAETVAAEEQNSEVLRFVLSFLNQLVHVDPERVEGMVLYLLRRGVLASPKAKREIEGATGNVLALLWVSHERASARAIIDEWLERPEEHKEEFGQIAFCIRSGLVLGYDHEDVKDDLIRRRCQELAAHVIEVTASMLDAYLETPPDEIGPDGPDRAGALAQIMDRMSDQFYFASGATAERHRNESATLSTPALRLRFLKENHTTLWRIGTSGTPHTIYHLIELMDFLSDADPPTVFDHVAHALLVGGRRHGFHFESLGANRFVKVIGRFLADYRSLFNEPKRRSQLIECLNVFAQAGWPAARRLLFQLPELLR
ncbi:MAG: hypothetical protein CML31_15925 [Rhizobiales bacterium]|nr:hypothetical protein [Hyphomicrobiales bacterium]